jgi:hypothetical protein
MCNARSASPSAQLRGPIQLRAFALQVRLTFHLLQHVVETTFDLTIRLLLLLASAPQLDAQLGSRNKQDSSTSQR